MNAYVITAGCYSDYHICGITLDKEKAEHIKKLCLCYYGSNEEVDIEEYELNKIESFKLTEEQLNSRPTHYFELWIKYDKENRKVYKIDIDECWKYENYGKIFSEDIFSPKIPWERCGPKNTIIYRVMIQDDDKEKAKKIALDRFYKLLVEKYHYTDANPEEM